MALPAFVQGTTRNVNSPTASITFPGNVTKGNLIMMLWGCAFGGGTPQDKGFADTLGSVYQDQGLINSDLGNSPAFAFGWAIAAATGACTITSGNTTAVNGYTIVCAEFSGAVSIENYITGANSDQVSPSFFTSPTITPSVATSLVVCLATTRQGVTAGAFTGTWTSGFTLAEQLMANGGVGVDIGYKVLTTAAATTATETVTNSGVNGQNNTRMTIMDFMPFGNGLGLTPLNAAWLAW